MICSKVRLVGVRVNSCTQRVAGTTRKEEIIRFGKATSTAEFSKMMKSRTLGPEHLETQIKLRRQMRVSFGNLLCVRCY